MADESEAPPVPQLFLVSDGTGETAAATVRAAMTQFRTRWRLRTFGEVRHESQLRRIAQEAQRVDAMLVYTLVRERLSRLMRELAAEQGVPTVDLLGELIGTVSAHFRLESRSQPGLLHGFTHDYFRRVDAVEFAVRHDDGSNLHSLFQAEIVLTGVSRTSKTPLSMYLAQRGYKTGNVPLVPEVPPPRELLDLDPRKVFGLVVEPSALLTIRRARIRALRAPPYLTYADPEAVALELRRARRLFRERGFQIVDITGRAVEENAARIVDLYHQRLGGAGSDG